MAGKTYTLRGSAAYLNRDGLTAMTDQEWAARVDTSPSIGAAYASTARLRTNFVRVAQYVKTFGVASKLNGEPVKARPTGFKRTSVPAGHKRPGVCTIQR